MFKPNISPVLLDQMKSHRLETTTLKTGEKVIVDPEHTTERVMLWVSFTVSNSSLIILIILVLSLNQHWGFHERTHHVYRKICWLVAILPLAFNLVSSVTRPAMVAQKQACSSPTRRKRSRKHLPCCGSLSQAWRLEARGSRWFLRTCQTF